MLRALIDRQCLLGALPPSQRLTTYRGTDVLRPNVRAKRATTAWRAGQQAQNGPKAQRLMASVTCRWRSA